MIEPPTDHGHTGPGPARRQDVSDVSDGDAASAGSKDLSGTSTSLAAALHLIEALPAAGCRQAASRILPAVETLRLLQDEPALQPWDTLIHRRCRLLPQPSPASEPLAPAVCVRRRERAGWQLLEVTVSTHTAQVRHELVRRCGQAPEARRSSPTLSGQASLATAPGPVRRILLEEQVVRAWAEASGDRNAVHLVPGAAREAGLAVSGEHTVAHGLLLAAISLAWVPWKSSESCAQQFDVSFHSPVPVCARHPAYLELDATGNLRWEGLTALRRR